MQMVVLESAGLTDVGKKRDGNEDSLLLAEDKGLFVVSDGMGGHQAGEVASRLVVETIRDFMAQYWAEKPAAEPEDADDRLSRQANRIRSGILLANRVVNQLSGENPAYRGMGATVSAAMFTEDTVITANVGDSPIYLIHEGAVEMISVPHTLLAEQAAIDPEGAKKLGGNFRHMLTRAMGVEETVGVDVSENQCFPGDILVICSDGLSDKLTPVEICRVAVEERPESACRKLVDLANERGGDDNITVIVIKVKAVRKQGGFFNKLAGLFGRG